MGKGKQHGGGGRGKQFSAPEELQRVGKQNSKAGMMPSSDEESEEEEEEEVQRGGQNPNAGMMPPSSDEDESEEEEDADTVRLRKILGDAGVPDGAMKELTAKLLRWKAGEPEKPSKAKAPRAPEPTRKEREAMAAKEGQKDEESSEEEADPAVQKRLEEVRKRREAQAKQRIAKDGWDRMKPMSEDNHPPGMAWPPPDQKAAADIS